MSTLLNTKIATWVIVTIATERASNSERPPLRPPRHLPAAVDTGSDDGGGIYYRGTRWHGPVLVVGVRGGVMATTDDYDTRWICWRCGDLDQLSDEGLCRGCTPEQVVEWWVRAMRVAHGEPKEIERRWWIG